MNCWRCFGLIVHEHILADEAGVQDWVRCVNCGLLMREGDMGVGWSEDRRRKFQATMAAKRAGRPVPDDEEEEPNGKPRRPRKPDPLADAVAHPVIEEADGGDVPLMMPREAVFTVRRDCGAFLRFARSWAEHYRDLKLVEITVEGDQGLTIKLIGGGHAREQQDHEGDRYAGGG